MEIIKITVLACIAFLVSCAGGSGPESLKDKEIPDTIVIQKQEVADEEFEMAEALKEYHQQQDTDFDETFRKEHTARNSLDYHGEYLGTLPCADCEGIRTKITLNRDNSFRLQRQYLETDDRGYVIEGTFSWEECGNIIRLNELDKPNLYHVGEGALFQLDMDGNRITGDLAHKYVLEMQY